MPGGILKPAALQDQIFDFMVVLPLIQNASYISSASDGGSQGSFSVTSAVGGTEVFRSATGKKPLPGYARNVILTKTDAAGTDLRMTVTVQGFRMGRFQQEDVDLNAASASQIVSSVKCYDEVSKVFIKSILAAAASDFLNVGFGGSTANLGFIGLPCDISNKDAIRSVLKIAAGTPDPAGPKINSDITDAMVMTEKFGSALDLATLYGANIAVTDRYLIKVISNGFMDYVPRNGVLY
jgi:hypothetical protein